MIGKEKICCFTGHRPAKLPWGYNETSEGCQLFKRRLTEEIEVMCGKGVTLFISGMAMGTDLIAAEIVLALKQRRPELRLFAAIPCQGQEARWSENYRERYYRVLKQADWRKILSPRYTQNCMQERNRYMVDHSAHIIAVFNGERGGTWNTVQYARSQGLDMAIINPNEYA